MKKVVLILLVILIYNTQGAFSQDFQMREIYVLKDSVYEINNLKKGFKISEAKINDGLHLVTVDLPYRVFYYNEVSNSVMNGVFFEAYIPSGMPKVKGNYLNNKKVGEWFYWSEKGRLLRKEVWKNGKLNQTIK